MFKIGICYKYGNRQAIICSYDNIWFSGYYDHLQCPAFFPVYFDLRIHWSADGKQKVKFPVYVEWPLDIL